MERMKNFAKEFTVEELFRCILMGKFGDREGEVVCILRIKGTGREEIDKKVLWLVESLTVRYLNV